MRFRDWEAEKMKDPEFREAVARLEKCMKYFGWFYYLQAWVDYFVDRFWEMFPEEDNVH